MERIGKKNVLLAQIEGALMYFATMLLAFVGVGITAAAVVAAAAIVLL